MAPSSFALLLALDLPTVVLPFDVRASGEEVPAGSTWKGAMLEETVSAYLEAVGLPVVGLFERNRLLEDIGVVPGEAVSRATALLIARELHADRLIFGTLTLTLTAPNPPPGDGAAPSSPTQHHVEAWLLDVDSGRTIGVVDDYGASDELPALASLVAKNLIRLERDDVPAGFDVCASRRAHIPLEALEAGALARITLDRAEQRAHLERAIAASEHYVEARVLLGRILLAAGEARGAIDVLVAARGDDRAYRNAYFDLGLAYLTADMAQAAVQVYGGLVDGGAGDDAAESQNNLGVALMRLSRFEEATAAFERGCQLGVDEATCRFNLGWAHWRSGKGAAALEQFEKLIASRPLDAEARLLHGAAAMSQARHDDAERSREAAILLSPRLADVEPSTVSGWARVVERPPAVPPEREAEAAAAAALLLDDGLETTADLLDARALKQRGRTDEAIQLLQRSLYREPDATFVRRELASLHVDAGALESAVSELSVLLWTDPTPESHVALARLYLQMEDPSRAMEEVESALGLEPGHEDALRLKEAIGASP